jgi:uncharacterized protein (TIGR02246 family)
MGTASVSSGGAGIEERLAALEDREAIRRLVQDYRRHLDARDLQAYSELFADDGEWQGGTGYGRGPRDIRSMLEAGLDPNPPAPGVTTFHVVTDPVIDLDGDRATGTVMWALLQRGGVDSPEIRLLGHYEDAYVRVDGQWKFARRRAHVDIPHRVLEPLP